MFYYVSVSQVFMLHVSAKTTLSNSRSGISRIMLTQSKALSSAFMSQIPVSFIAFTVNPG